MPAKSNHKIMKHGTSGVVVIPKAYRDYYGLKPGDPVTILYDSILIVIPERAKCLLTQKAHLIDQLLGQSTGD
jgi:AbrB family looped-hinge helix DNA binding protein